MSDINIRGFIETSLLDWDGKVSCVVFLPYCNFRCPFCDNGILINAPEKLPLINPEKVINFISERKDFLDGVVITGGEPSIHPWLKELIQRFKALGTLVKLDTNGTNPEALANLIVEQLIDYVAMDLKAPLEDSYHAAAGVKADLKKIRESINILKTSGLAHEFRTTIVPTLHDELAVEKMAHSIAGAPKYALQQFVPDHTLDERLRIIAPYSKEKISSLVAIAQKYVPNTIARGV